MGLEEIGTFVEAAERGSLTAAAKALGVPKSTVSRRIARLEEELGAELVRRSARSFRLTEAGEALFRRSAPAIRDVREATRRVHDDAAEVSGELRVTVPVDIGASPPLVRLFVAFRAAHPKVRLSIDLTDRLVDLVDEGYDFAFRVHYGQLADRSGLKVRRLTRLTAGLYASRAYLDRRGRPAHPDALADHDAVTLDRPMVRDRWVLRRGEEEGEFPIRPVILANGMAFVPAAVDAGAGIGLVPDVVAALLKDAERVLPDWEMPAVELSLLWPASRVASPRVRAFLDFAAGHADCGG
ncbi:MAG: LysR substrate-binding domain-containing protein [Myxococcota bacterium]